jgi:translation initiation factor 3 subunit B
MEEEFVPQVSAPFKPRPDTRTWLTDAKCRDQFVLRYGTETEIYWGPMAPDDEPNMFYGGQTQKASKGSWCDLYVKWSPKGTYLATFHTRGILLWGGDQFKECGRFMHENVQEIQFSPCERYISTYRTLPFPNQKGERVVLCVCLCYLYIYIIQIWILILL